MTGRIEVKITDKTDDLIYYSLIGVDHCVIIDGPPKIIAWGADPIEVKKIEHGAYVVSTTREEPP